MTVPTKLKLNNKGATLIELIIIIAIIAVLVSGSIVAFTVLNSSNLKQAVRTTGSYLGTARTKAMSVVADEWYFLLKQDGENCYAEVYKVYTNDDDEQVVEKIEEKDLGVRVAASLISDDDETDIEDGDELKIKFSQSSGSVSSVDINGTEFNPTENMITIRFLSGSKEMSVDLYFVSGKVEIHE